MKRVMLMLVLGAVPGLVLCASVGDAEAGNKPKEKKEGKVKKGKKVPEISATGVVPAIAILVGGTASLLGRRRRDAVP